MAEETTPVTDNTQDPPVKRSGLFGFVDSINQRLKPLKPIVTPGFSESQETPDTNSSIAKDLTQYRPYIDNPDPIDPNLDLKRAKGQSVVEQSAHAVGQFATQFVGGAAMALGTSTDIEQSINTVRGTEKEYTNALYEFGKDLIQKGSNAMPIYEKDPGSVSPSDFAWWANMGASTGLSAGIMAEGLAETAAVSYLTEGSGLGTELTSLGNKLRDAKGLQAIFSTVSNSERLKNAATMFGVIQRQHESVMEGADAFRESYNDQIAKGYSDSQARDIAAKAGHATYLANLPLMALDVLGMKAMTFNPVSGAAEGGLIDSFLEHTLGNVKNPLLRKVAAYGIESGSEGAEEFWQYLASEEGKRYANVASGQKDDGKGLIDRFGDTYSKSGELWNNTLSGIFGGVVLGGLQHGMGNLINGRAEKARNLQYDTFVNNVSGIGLDLTNKINDTNDKSDPVTGNNLRRQLGVHKAITALHLDHINDKDSAFSGYTNYLNQVHDAAINNDTDKLGQLGITDTDFIKDHFPNYISDANKIKDIYDDVKENNDRNSIYNITHNRFLVDVLNQQKLQNDAKIAAEKVNIPDLNNLTPPGALIYESKTQEALWKSQEDYLRKQLDKVTTDEDKQAIQAAIDKASFSRAFHQTRIQDQTELLKDYDGRNEDDEILKSVGSQIKLQRLQQESVNIDSLLTKTRKELNIWQDKNFQAKNSTQQTAQLIDQVETVKEADQLAKSLQEGGNLTPVHQRALASKRAELSANEETEALKNKTPVDTTQSPLSSFIQQNVTPQQTQEVNQTEQVNLTVDQNQILPFGVPQSLDQSEIQDNIPQESVINPERQQTANDLFGVNSGIVRNIKENVPVNVPTLVVNPTSIEDIAGNLQAAIARLKTPEPISPKTQTVYQEDSLFSPSPIDDKNLRDEKKEQIRSQIQNYTNSLKADLGKEPSFKDLAEDFIQHTSKDQVDKNWNLLKLGWELNGKKANYDQVYNDLFSDRKALGLNFFDSNNDIITSEEELEKQNEIISEKEIEEQADPKQFDLTETGQKEFKPLNKYRTVSSSLKFAHLSIPYIKNLIRNSEGNISDTSYENSSDELNQSQYIDSKELMDPNKWGTGTKGEIRVHEDANNILIAQWDKDYNKLPAVKFSEWAKNKDKTSDEYIGRLPMIIASPGAEKGVAFVHDMEWYNPSNVGYAEDKVQQSQIIEDSRKELLALRKQVLATGGNLAIEVTEKKPGTKYIIPRERPLMTINEANPQAKIAYVNKLNNLSTKDGIISADQLINKSELTIGHKYDIRQAGLDEREQPIYFAAKLLYPTIDKEAKMSIIQALRVYTAQEDIGEKLSKQDEIKKLRKDVIEHTGLDLYDKADLEKYLNLFIPTVKESVGSGKGSEQRVYDAIESNPAILNGTPFIAIQGGAVVFGTKGFKASPTSSVNYFYPGMLGTKANNPEQSAKVITSMLNKMYKDDFLGQMKQNMDGRSLEKDSRTAHIVFANGQSSVVPQGNYNDYLKDRLQTNIKSFDLGEGSYATFVQPVINYTYNKELAEVKQPTEAQQTTPNFIDIVNEATKEITGLDPQTEQAKLVSEVVLDLDAFKALGLDDKAMKALQDLKGSQADFDPDYQSLTDDIVRSIKTKLTKIEDLDTIDRGHIVQFIANEVMNKIDPQSRNTIEKNSLIADVNKTFENLISPKLSLIDAKIGPLTQLIETGNFPNLRQVVDQLNNFKNNADILKKNWNFLINEAFEDYISKFTGISIKMSRAQDNIDVTIEDQDVIQDTKDREEDQQDLRINLGDEREKNYSKESIEDNGKNSVSYLVKRFLAQIPNYDKSGNPKIGFMGVTTYPGFDFYYDAVGKMLTSRGDVISDFDDLKLRLSQFSEAQPYVNEIIKRLDASDQQLKNAFMYNFVRDGLSMKFVMTSFDNKTQNYKLKVFDTNANEILRVIQTQWRNNFNQSALVNSDNNVNVVKAQALLDKFNSWVSGKLPNAKEAKDFLHEFGIELSNDAVNELISKGYYVSEGKKSSPYAYSKMFTKSSSSNGVFGLLARSLELMVQADNKNYVENDTINPFENMSGVLAKLANIESKYSVSLTTNSFRDGDKTIFGFTPGKFATSMVSKLKYDDQVRAAKSQISFDKGSFILGLLNTDQEFVGKFGIDHIGINAFKELGKPLYKDNELNSLSDADHELVKLGMFQDTQQGEVKSETVEGLPLRIGRMFFPTMSDKKTMLDITTAVLDLKPKDLDVNTGDLNQPLQDFLFSQLVQPELDRIISHHKRAADNNIHPNALVNQKAYNIAAQMFHFIPEMNNLEYTQENGEKIRLIEFLANSGNQITPQVYQALVTKIKTSANGIVTDLIRSMANDKLAAWEDNEYITRNEQDEITKIKFLNKDYLDKRAGSLQEKLNMAAYDYVINSAVNNANMHMLVAGDVANFSQDKAFKKGFEKDENGNPLVYKPLDNSIYSKISSDIIGVNLGKRLAMLIAPGNTIAQSKGDQYVQLFARDRVTSTENIGFLINLYHGKEAESSNQELIRGLKSADPKVVDNSVNELSNKFPDLAAYLSIESTDAQEYTTAKEAIDIMYRQGRLSVEDYEDFKRKIATQIAYDKKGLSIPEESFLSTDNLRLIFQPHKPVVTGQMNDVANDMSRMIYIKSSAFALIPQITQAFPHLNELRKGMEDVQEQTGKNVRLSYDTANKVGSPLNSHQIQLWDNQGNYIPEVINGKNIADQLKSGVPNGAMVMDRENFRIQQDVPFKSAKIDHQDEVTLGTQMMKEIFGDGVGQITDKIFNHNGVLKSGKRLMDEVSQHYDNWLRNEKSILYDQLGVDESTGEAQNIAKTTQKLQSLLQQEAKKRGYPKQDIDALEVSNIHDADGNVIGSQFVMPLWLSPNSNRYEALLNAIVTNRLLNLTLPGTSSVVGSEEGFRTQEDMSGVDTSRVIFRDNWSGSLQPRTGTQLAQVLAPSKFRDKDGSLLDLFKKDENGKEIYVTKQSDGSWRLNEDKLNDEMKSNSGFRIPTSSHVSMSQDEVVGFLPPEAGDLRIVPKNYTKQKGLDYDVDKENTYMLHHTIADNGKIIPIEKSGINLDNYQEEYKDIVDIIDSFQSTLASNSELTKLINEYKDEIDISNEMGFDPSDAKKFIKQLKGELDHNIKKSDLKQIVQYFKQFKELKSKLHQNEIVKAYSAILSSSDKRVQQKINKVLSTDFAEGQADLLSSLSNKSKDNKNFSILSDQYQKDKMALGAAGKMGIGVYSNYVVFHSLVQQSPKPIELTYEVMTDTGPITVPYQLTIGNLKSDGRLGKIDTIDGARSITDVNAERQNTATDNEKLQIMGKTNTNELTINVDATLSLLGFDQSKATINGKEQVISVPYFLLSQPIIKDYVDMMRKVRSNIAEYNPNAEFDVLTQLNKKYSNNGEFDPTSSEQVKAERAKLTGQKLANNILDKGQDGVSQQAILHLFSEVKGYADSLTSLQSKTNIQRNGLGKSMFEMLEKYNNVASLASNGRISNVDSLIGDYIHAEDLAHADLESLKANGYVLFNMGGLGDSMPFAVKPTTITGSLVIQSAKAGYELWNKYFPHSNNIITKTMNDIMSMTSGENISESKKLKMQYEIFDELKKYLYSSDRLGLFKGDPQVERERLFFDRNNSESLATYLKNLTKSDHPNKDIVAENKLISKFTYTLEKGKVPSIIKYDNSKSEDFNEEYKYQAIIELMDKNVPLVDFQGQPYTSRMLAKDLINYAYLEGGIQQAIQFVKYIPVEYLKAMGFSDSAQMWQRGANGELFRGPNNTVIDIWQSILGTTQKDLQNTEYPRFIQQYFQHNAGRLQKLTEDNIDSRAREYDGDKRTLENLVKFLPKDLEEEPKPYITIYNRDIKQKNKNQIYKFDGQSYNRIPTLGIFGLSEYSIKDNNVAPLIDTNRNVVQANLTDQIKQNSIIQRAFFELDKGHLGNTLQQIADANLASGLSETAKLLQPYLNSSIKLQTGDVNGGRSRGMYENNTITIDSTFLGKPGTTKELIASTILHEYTHALTSEQLSQYFDKKDGSLKVAESELPANMKRLNRLYREIEKTLGTDLEKFRQWYATPGNQGTLRTLDDRLLYAGMNIHEFTAMIMSEPDIQTKMAGIQYKESGKTLLQQFFDSIKKILNQLGLNFDENSATAQGIDSVLSILDEQKQSYESGLNKLISSFGEVMNPSETDLQLKDYLDSIEPKDENDFPHDFEASPEIQDLTDCIF